ncbi:MAG TPA: LysR family transcriptional regulator [Patescibacteria group bacterium]|nr:LysR family transcriptional regulator [Patescibacteria group bacterium]
MEDRLNKFVCVVDQGGFGKAADFLHISQPALTTAIKKLEKELGMVLLIRSNRKITLTRAGEEVYQTSKNINGELKNLTQRLARLNLEKPKITIGMIDSIANTLFEEGTDFEKFNQLADIYLTVNTSKQLISAVARGELQAAIAVCPSEGLPTTLTGRYLGDEPLIMVVHPSLKAEYKKQVKAKKLKNFLSYNISSQTRKVIENFLTKQQIEYEAIFHSTSPEVMLRMVFARQGAAVLPYVMVRRALTKDKLSNLSPEIKVISRPIYLIHHRNFQLMPEAQSALSSAGHILEKLMNSAKS